MLISRVVTFLQLLTAALGNGRQTHNIAVHKSAKQSSTFENPKLYARAELAVDGIADSFFWSGSCAHTTLYRNNTEAWWEVDLEKQYRIDTIRILNRDYSVERLHDVSVDVFEGTHQMRSGKHCNTHTGSAGPGWLHMTCASPVTGRYVRITKTKRNWNDALTLCEVEIYGVPEIFRSNYLGRMAMTQDLSGGEKMTARSHLHCGTISVSAGDCFGFTAKEQEHENLQCQVLFDHLDKDGNGMGGNYTSYFAVVV